MLGDEACLEDVRQSRYGLEGSISCPLPGSLSASCCHAKSEPPLPCHPVLELADYGRKPYTLQAEMNLSFFPLWVLGIDNLS